MFLLPSEASTDASGGKISEVWDAGTCLSDDVVAAEPVFVHDGDDDGGLPQHMGGHVEREGLVEDRVETALHRHRLLLLHALVFVHQPHLHVWICSSSQETKI